jgi:predicted ester cyclase
MATLEEMARQGIEAFNNRTYEDNIRATTAENHVNVDLATGQEQHGIEGAIAGAEVWINAFPDAAVEVVSMEVEGNVVTTRFIGRGTFNGQLPAPDGSMIQGQGQSLEMEYVQSVEIVDEKAVRTTIDYDMGAMMGQLGLG